MILKTSVGRATASAAIEAAGEPDEAKKISIHARL
jgi:hypothetical protein